ncbi:MAG: HD domain-containing protein [Pyrobaculum arsenaticum]|uniref:Metal dependent phosphohydrolase n=2 Tax=Pyrobaculum arsenaticum TaxID=121277 RepID=A4WL25_PYRAR|nr:HD domain-containing protein [Pyrobaculum arsenaticum]ABP51092.1 metal dependent phosphohydrolase [Pyrobaculum arsenaticum DSM 13514]MCY0891670.1 HD domain-containing protein [Pyrobaculum arsenaticum]NYR15183.1 HD domain-containing protein [Pyrobaculum arsenaticum]
MEQEYKYEVGVKLIEKTLPESDKVRKVWELLTTDVEVQAYLKMSNVFAVQRLRYNDHGPIHSRIVAGSALAIYKILTEKGFKPSVVADGVGDWEDSIIVTLMGAYLHDIGNSVHRTHHPIYSAMLTDRIAEKILSKIYGISEKAYMLKQEVMHAVFCHDEAYNCLTFEAACAKIADGTDMSSGRARYPYRAGKNDIHALSALSIERVELSPNGAKPLTINVYMSNETGIFQIDTVLGQKIATSGLAPYVEVRAYVKGKLFAVRSFETTHVIRQS